MVERERGPIVVRTGMFILVLGAIGTALDTISSGCVSTGPCQAVPPLPIAILVFTLGVGVGLLIGGLVLRTSEQNHGGIGR